MSQFVHGFYVFDSDCLTARRAEFEELAAKERAQHLAYSILDGRMIDKNTLVGRMFSVLQEARIEPLFRSRVWRGFTDLSRDKLAELAGQALIEFANDLTKKRARNAERFVYALGAVT